MGRKKKLTPEEELARSDYEEYYGGHWNLVTCKVCSSVKEKVNFSSQGSYTMHLWCGDCGTLIKIKDNKYYITKPTILKNIDLRG